MSIIPKYRQEFATFLEELASGQIDHNKWGSLVITHYHDQRLEEIRCEVVRQGIAESFDPPKLRAWAMELRVMGD